MSAKKFRSEKPKKRKTKNINNEAEVERLPKQEHQISNPSKKLQEKIDTLNTQANQILEKIEKIRQRRCFVIWENINRDIVDEVYLKLRGSYKDLNGKLDVIVHSGGGDIDAAYNIASILRKHANKDLTFIVP